MRIFTAVRHSIDPNFYYGRLWSDNFYPALRHLGHDIVESSTDLLPASKFMEIANRFTPEELEVRAGITQRIIEEVKRAHAQQPINLFLSYFYNAHFDPVGFAEIHKLGIPTVNFYCNSIYQFDLVGEIAAAVNFSWHSEKAARNLYLNVGANPVWVQMGADPAVYHPVNGLARQNKACFVGMRYADRERLLARLIEDGVLVDIYGHGWSGGEPRIKREASQTTMRKYLGRDIVAAGSSASYLNMAWRNMRAHGLVDGTYRNLKQYQFRRESSALAPVILPATRGTAANIAQTFARYEVILNFSNVWADGRSGSKLISHVRLRDFEAPMCRTCYITGYTDEIADFYELEKEILTYRTPEELVAKVTYYLAHPSNAETVREAGYQRALRDHTWVQRFGQLFRLIGLTK